MVDSSTKDEKWKAELLFVEDEAKRIAARKAQEDELRKFPLTKQLALAEAETNLKQITEVEGDESNINNYTPTIPINENQSSLSVLMYMNKNAMIDIDWLNDNHSPMRFHGPIYDKLRN